MGTDDFRTDPVVERDLGDWLDKTAEEGRTFLASGEAKRLIDGCKKSKGRYTISEAVIRQRASAGRRPRRKRDSQNDFQALTFKILIELGRDLEKLLNKWTYRLQIIEKKREQKGEEKL